MIVTAKRVTLNLSKEDVRLLENLKDIYGESTQDIFKRALLYLEIFRNNKFEDKK